MSAVRSDAASVMDINPVNCILVLVHYDDDNDGINDCDTNLIISNLDRELCRQMCAIKAGSEMATTLFYNAEY